MSDTSTYNVLKTNPLNFLESKTHKIPQYLYENIFFIYKYNNHKNFQNPRFLHDKQIPEDCIPFNYPGFTSLI